MSEPQSVFAFRFRAVLADTTGYLVVRWDRSKTVVVNGATKGEAVSKLMALVGEPPNGYYWKFKLDEITELV